MTGKENEIPAVGNNEEAPSNLISEIQKIRSEMAEMRQEMMSESGKYSKSSKTHAQEHVDILEKLQSIENLVSKIQPEVVMETKDAVDVSNASSSLSLDNPTIKDPEVAKSFVLKYVFKEPEKFENDKWNVSEKEEHFGVNWCINLIHKDDRLQFYLHVDHPGKNWKIETEFDLKIIGPRKTDCTKPQSYGFDKSVGYGYDAFLKWEEAIKNYLEEGHLTAEIHVKILQTKGLREEKFRNFDESVKEVSDIVLAVKDRKFHASKMFLAAQSSFFKALLLGNFAESKKSEVTLTGIDPEDFHFFLEVLYGEDAIDDITVEGIALLADMYDSPTAMRRSEGFMIKESKKTLKKKLQMADRYNLDTLKKKCLSEIKTMSDIKSVVPNNFQYLDHSTVSALLEKAISVGEQ